MSFPPQGSLPRNALAAGLSQRHRENKLGSVRAARERLQARQRAEALGTWAEQPSVAEDSRPGYLLPNAPERPWEARQHSNPVRGVVEENYDHLDSEEELTWPLPVSESRFAMKGSARAPEYLEAHDSEPQELRQPQTFFDSSKDANSDSSLPSEATFDRRSDDQDYTTSLGWKPSKLYPSALPPSSERSLADIPDFPLPASQYQPGRRSQNLGPPPVHRRGPSSYYSQFCYVSPIAEELSESRGSFGSYASSSVIPSQMPAFYLEETPSDEEDGSAVDFDWRRDEERLEESGLVRKASVGQRGKPILTTIRSEDGLRGAEKSTPAERGIVHSPGARISRVASIMDGQSVLLDATSSERSKEKSINGLSPGTQHQSTFDLYHPEAQDISGDSRIGSPSGRGNRPESGFFKTGNLSERVGGRRPPSLNVEAVKAAEARGSLTSLPDLIKRATRLAANLDRGKTASRLGMDWMTSDQEKPDQTLGATNRRRASGTSSISGMLNAFPPPRLLTPGGTITPRNDWPVVDNSQKSLSSNPKGHFKEPKKQHRQACGMSLRAFIFCVIVVLLLIAAAIILPVVLIVLPGRSKALAAGASPTATLQSCLTKFSCSNGGTSTISSNDACGCICTNGYTGLHCDTNANAACTSVAAAGASSASLGTQIPLLIAAARQNFSIPLDSTTLLLLFASTNMTCTTENALVTFPNSPSSQKQAFLRSRSFLPARRRDLSGQDSSFEDGSALEQFHPRDAKDSLDGLLTASSQPVATSTGTAPITVGTGSPAPGTNSTSIQFAKVGVLFVLQDSHDLSTAVSAQEHLSQYLSSATKLGSTMDMAHNVTLGGGYSIDLWYLTVTLKNGTQYGMGYNGTATSLNVSAPAKPAKLSMRLFP